MIFQIRHQQHKQRNKKYISGTLSNPKASAQYKTTTTTINKMKRQSGREYLQAIYPIRGYYQKYISNSYDSLISKNEIIQWKISWIDAFPKTYRWPVVMWRLLAISVRAFACWHINLFCPRFLFSCRLILPHQRPQSCFEKLEVNNSLWEFNQFRFNMLKKNSAVGQIVCLIESLRGKSQAQEPAI